MPCFTRWHCCADSNGALTRKWHGPPQMPIKAPLTRRFLQYTQICQVVALTRNYLKSSTTLLHSIRCQVIQRSHGFNHLNIRYERSHGFAISWLILSQQVGDTVWICIKKADDVPIEDETEEVEVEEGENTEGENTEGENTEVEMTDDEIEDRPRSNGRWTKGIITSPEIEIEVQSWATDEIARQFGHPSAKVNSAFFYYN